MGIKVKINDAEVKNPLAKLVITLTTLIVIILLFALFLFLVFPLIWFLFLSVLIVLIAVMLISPKLSRQYKILNQENKRLADNSKNK